MSGLAMSNAYETSFLEEEAVAVDNSQNLRIIEAVLFAADAPLSVDEVKTYLPEGADAVALLQELRVNFTNRGVHVTEVAGKWALRTADDLSFLLRRETVEQKRLSKAALETLAIVAYHQPVTRADIEDIRGVAISKGTLDILMEIGWVKMRGRRKAPGRPVTYGTTEAFLIHFGLAGVTDLPGLQELKGAGLLEATVPPGFDMPMPRNLDVLAEDEEPLEADLQDVTVDAAPLYEPLELEDEDEGALRLPDVSSQATHKGDEEPPVAGPHRSDNDRD